MRRCAAHHLAAHHLLRVQHQPLLVLLVWVDVLRIAVPLAAALGAARVLGGGRRVELLRVEEDRRVAEHPVGSCWDQSHGEEARVQSRAGTDGSAVLQVSRTRSSTCGSATASRSSRSSGEPGAKKPGWWIWKRLFASGVLRRHSHPYQNAAGIDGAVRRTQVSRRWGSLP